MSNTFLIIGETYLKENSTIPLNVETNLLSSAIRDAQEIKIRGALTTPLYNKIQELLNSGTVSETYRVLIDDYIVPALLQWSIAEAIFNVRFKITNQTVGSQSGDYSDPGDLDHIKFLRSAVISKADYCVNQLKTFLNNNRDDYPEYEPEPGAARGYDEYSCPIEFY